LRWASDINYRNFRQMCRPGHSMGFGTQTAPTLFFKGAGLVRSATPFTMPTG